MPLEEFRSSNSQRPCSSMVTRACSELTRSPCIGNGWLPFLPMVKTVTLMVIVQLPHPLVRWYTNYRFTYLREKRGENYPSSILNLRPSQCRYHLTNNAEPTLYKPWQSILNNKRMLLRVYYHDGIYCCKVLLISIESCEVSDCKTCVVNASSKIWSHPYPKSKLVNSSV